MGASLVIVDNVVNLRCSNRENPLRASDFKQWRGLHSLADGALHQTQCAMGTLFSSAQDMRYSTQDTDMTTLTIA
jgi:hypothetical protein